MSEQQVAWQSELERCERLMASLLDTPGLNGRSIGVPEWDATLMRLGHEWIASSSLDWSNDSGRSAPARDVYLATHLYDTGGHTALIGDFIRALDGDDGSGRGIGSLSRVIVTGLLGQASLPLAAAVQQRIGLPVEQVTVTTGPTLLDRANQLFAQLHAFRPSRLFLFQHPGDVLASVCAQPEVAATRVMVHHADSCPTFGLYLPDVRIIDLSPSAVALTRLLGGRSSRLTLTAVDPGPRPREAVRRGALVTASCGSAHKFFRGSVPSYPEVIAQVLRATGGWHIHVGGLDNQQRQQIDRALDATGCARDRFEHIAFSPLLAQTLWDRGCDVYLASFPISGARTRVEILAAGIPYLRHSFQPLDESEQRSGDLAWHSVGDLLDCLESLESSTARSTAAAGARAEYERVHQPGAFAAALHEILERRTPRPDPDANERRLITLESMTRTIVTALLPQAVPAAPPPPSPAPAPVPAPPDPALEAMRLQIDQLREECLAWAAQVSDLREECRRWSAGSSWQGAFRRWLRRD